MSESQIQTAIVGYLRTALPKPWLIQHTANKPRSKIAGAIEKKMGSIKGWPDLMVLGPVSADQARPHAWFIEVKTDKGRLSPEQKELHARLIGLGFGVGTVRSIDDARRLAIAWGLPLREAA